MTGFATLFAADATKGQWDQAAGIVSLPLFFLLGVMVSAYLVDRRVHRGQRPHYALVMSLVCLCLLGAALGGHFDLFGSFGSEPRLSKDYMLLALLCAASGLQNAAISTSSGATVRTTHLTGVTTDLGTGLVRAFSNPAVFRMEMQAVRLRMGTISAFIMGSLIGSYFYLKFHYLGFLLPATLSAYSIYEALGPRRRLARLRRRH